MARQSARTRKGPAMTQEARDAELRDVVEEVGLWFESSGVPRMAGRVVGWLMVCDQPEQTMAELAEELGASMGSISTMTRLLMQMGLIERKTTAGERRVRYRLRPEAFSWTIEDRLAHIRSFLDIAERARRVLEAEEPLRRERVERIQQGIRFYEEEMGLILDRWRRRQTAG